MYFLLYMVRRYGLSKSARNVVTVINRVTFLVVVIGTASLLIVLSGFAGLKTFSVSFTNKFDPDLKAVSARGKFFSLSSQEEAQLSQVKGLDSYSKEVEERVFLTFKEKNHVAYIKGVDDLYNRVTQIDSALYAGDWFTGTPGGVVPGLGTSSLLGLAVGDSENLLKILAPKPGKGTLLNDPKPYNEWLVQVTGVYAISEELDKKYIFAPLNMVQQLLQKAPTEITGINGKLQKGADRQWVMNAITSILRGKVVVKTREQQNEALYKMLRTEHLAIYFIFTLILIIALFNVVGAIFMMILDKRAHIRTLFCLGLTINRIKMLFFIQGLSVTLIGGITGILLAMLLIASQQVFGWLRITASLPYPVELTFFNVAIVFATIAMLGAAASGIAAGRISEKLVMG